MASIVREITARIRNDAHILLCVLKSNFAFKRAQGDLSFFKIHMSYIYNKHYNARFINLIVVPENKHLIIFW